MSYRNKNNKKPSYALDSQDRIVVYDAFEIKDALKKRGFRWDGIEKVWYHRPPNTPAFIQRIASEFALPLRTGTEKTKVVNPNKKSDTSKSLIDHVNVLLKQNFSRGCTVAGEIMQALQRRNVLFVDVASEGHTLTCCLDHDDPDKHFEEGAVLTLASTAAPRIWRNGKLALTGQSRCVTIERTEKGKVAASKEKTLVDLREEGLLQTNKALHLPRYCRRIFLVTSQGSRAQTDFLDEIVQDNFTKFVTVTVNTSVQGQDMVAHTLAAFQHIKATHAIASKAAADVVVLTRGGGSQLELNGFNHLDVAKAVATCPLPVITAIGHHADTTLCDQVAYQAVKTPTAAAQWLVQRVKQAQAHINQAWSSTLFQLKMQLNARQGQLMTTTLRQGHYYMQRALVVVQRQQRDHVHAFKAAYVQSFTSRSDALLFQQQRLKDALTAALDHKVQQYHTVKTAFETWVAEHANSMQQCYFVDARQHLLDLKHQTDIPEFVYVPTLKTTFRLVALDEPEPQK